MSRITRCDICGEATSLNGSEFYLSGKFIHNYAVQGQKSYILARHTYDICGKCFDKHLKNLLFDNK